MKEQTFFTVKLCLLLTMVAFGFTGCELFRDQNEMFALDPSLPAIGRENQLSIVTWNLETFPKQEESTVRTVQSIIERLNADIFCIQEIHQLEAFRSMMNRIPEYNYVINSSNRNLRLAILYNTLQVSLIKSKSLFKSAEKDTLYYYPNSPPLTAQFQFTGDESFRFTVINLHLHSGVDSADIHRRYKSAEMLHDHLESQMNPGATPLILAGDWNSDLNYLAEDSSLIPFWKDTNSYRFITSKLNLNSDSTSYTYIPHPIFIDHIVISQPLFPSTEVDTVATLRLDDYLDDYVENVSDHRPVFWQYRIE